MKPFSGLYYIKENKGKSLLVIFMLMLTTFIFVAGNYIHSVFWYWGKAIEYEDRIVMIDAISTDEDFRDYRAILEDLRKDGRVTVLERSARGYTGLSWDCTMGFEMGSSSFVFTSVEDMKTAFQHLGITCDYSNLKENSVVMSSALAKNRGLEVGDVLDQTVEKSLSGTYTFDAMIDDDSFILFYIKNDGEQSMARAYIMSDELSGDALRQYISDVQNGRKLKISGKIKDEIDEQMDPFKLIFFVAIVLVSIILAVTINAVLTGQYVKRTYEFGVYRALGRSKGNVFRKVTGEILIMDLLAILTGFALMFLMIFLLNELLYKPSGKYLPYGSGMGILGFLLSNILVVIPTILLKGRKLAKADVTEF